MSETDTLDFQGMFRRWAFEGVESLSPIRGYSELLLNESKFGSLTEQQRHFIEIIHHRILSALDHWQDPLHYINLEDDKYVLSWMKWERKRLQELVDSARFHLKGYDIGEIKIETSDSLPLLRANQWLVFAFANLIFPETNRQFSKYPCIIKASAIKENKVTIQISAHIRDIEEGYIKEDRFNISLLYPGSRLLTARLVIEELFESRLEIDITRTGIECKFDIPIWQVPSDIPSTLFLNMENNNQIIELILGQDIIVNLPYIGQAECDSKILVEAGGSGRSTDSGPEIYEVRFWARTIGQTSLKINYHHEGSTENKIFSILVNIVS